MPEVSNAPTTEPSEEVRSGMMLLFRDDMAVKHGGSVRFDLYAVKSVRRLKNGDAKVTLIKSIDCGSVEASATFPDGEIREPFKVFQLSQSDFERVWNGRS